MSGEPGQCVTGGTRARLRVRSKAPCVDYGMGVQAGVGRLHHMSKMDLGRQAARQGLSKGLSEVGSGEDEVGLARNIFQPSDPLDWGV